MFNQLKLSFKFIERLMAIVLNILSSNTSGKYYGKIIYFLTPAHAHGRCGGLTTTGGLKFLGLITGISINISRDKISDNCKYVWS